MMTPYRRVRSYLPPVPLLPNTHRLVSNKLVVRQSRISMLFLGPELTKVFYANLTILPWFSKVFVVDFIVWSSETQKNSPLNDTWFLVPVVFYYFFNSWFSGGSNTGSQVSVVDQNRFLHWDRDWKWEVSTGHSVTKIFGPIGTEDGVLLTSRRSNLEGFGLTGSLSGLHEQFLFCSVRTTEYG